MASEHANSTREELSLKVKVINKDDADSYATTVYGYKNTDIETIVSTSCAVQIKNNIDIDIFAATNFLKRQHRCFRKCLYGE